MVPIPYAVGYRATRRGRVPKLVKCEQCSLEYVYFLQRSAVGQGTSLLFLDNEGARSRAAAEASARLRTALMEGCEPVPCPGCGHVQEHMVSRARQLRHRWMGKAGLYLFPTAAILFLSAMGAAAVYHDRGSPKGLIIALLLSLLTAVAGLGAVGLPVWKYFSNRRYDPNGEDVEARKQLGRTLAVSRAEFEQRQALPGT